MAQQLMIPASQVQLGDIIVENSDPLNNYRVVDVWPPGQFGNRDINWSIVTFSLQLVSRPTAGNCVLSFPQVQLVSILRD
jgi:hypothetical protein